jgi:hypothetical protein
MIWFQMLIRCSLELFPPTITQLVPARKQDLQNVAVQVIVGVYHCMGPAIVMLYVKIVEIAAMISSSFAQLDY